MISPELFGKCIFTWCPALTGKFYPPVFYPELFTNPFFTVNTGKHQKLSFAAVFSYKQNNQKLICQRLKRVNNAGYT
jgi:hypothetical protein